MKTAIRSILPLLVISLFSLSTNLRAQCVGGTASVPYCFDGTTDATFELFVFAPSAGMTAQSTITAGDLSFNATLAVYERTTGPSLGTKIYGPKGGDLSGDIISASSADLELVFIIHDFGFGFSCSDFVNTPLEVCSKSITPVVTPAFSAQKAVCKDAVIQTGLSGGTPGLGTYSGPGVTHNGATFSFDPTDAAVFIGANTLTYTYLGNSATTTITVINPTAGVTFSAPADRAIDAGTLTGQGGGTPAGGVYSGPGVTDNGNGTTYSFNPVAAGQGTHSITYAVGGGTCVKSDDIVVLEATGCTSCGAPGETCFFHCYEDNESDLVIFQICPTAGKAAQATIEEGTYDISGADNLKVFQGALNSGTSGTLILAATKGNLAGTVVTATEPDQCLIFVSNSDAFLSCADDGGFSPATPLTPIHACGRSVVPPVMFTAPDDLCFDAGLQSGLTGGTPSGGVYSGTGVVDAGNGINYSLDPSVGPTGDRTITYTYLTVPATDVVKVLTSTDVSFTALGDLCYDAGIQTGLSGGTPAGGVYSGPGVTDKGDGTYDFNPAIAGVGVHFITYSVGGSCSKIDDVEVTAACNCACTGALTCYFHSYGDNESDQVVFEVCPSAGNKVHADILKGVYDTDDKLTVYEGASGSGITGTVRFGPSSGDFAGTTIFATGLNQCLVFVSNSNFIVSNEDGFITDPLVVCGGNTYEPVDFTAPGDICNSAPLQENLGGGTPQGGVYSGLGVTDRGDGKTYTFDPSVGAPGVRTLTYRVTFLDGTMVPATDDIEVFAGPTAGIAITETSDATANDGIICNGDPVTLTASPATGVDYKWGVNAGNSTLQTVIVNPTVNTNYTVEVTSTVNGCKSEKSVSITVDHTPPLVTCKSAIVILSSAGLGTLAPIDILDTGSDNCGTVNRDSISRTNFSCTDVGTSPVVTLYVSDGNGNTNTCTATITIQDNTAPTALCKNVTAELDINGTASVTAQQVNNGSNDACGIQSLSVPPHSFTCADIGTPANITLTVTDKNSNISTCVSTVTIKDNLGPIVQCKDINLELHSNGSVALSPIQVYLSHQENCGPMNIFSVSPSQFTCADAGKTRTVTLFTSDLNGNSGTCNAKVTIIDYTPPTLACKNTTIALNTSGKASIVPADLIISLTDVCGIGTMNLDKKDFICSNAGLNPVKLTVTDVNGNSSTCLATVTVLSNPAIHPGAIEICDGIDNNCNGVVDEGFDLDGDGFTSCGGDCNDNDATIYPGKAEVCDGKDNNCNGQIDEGVTPTWYADTDGDGFGDSAKPTLACSKPEGYVGNNTDCDDTNAAINSSSPEICDGLDNDCDGTIDNGAGPIWFADTDGDGFGDRNKPLQACVAPSGYVNDNTDCNDADGAVYPGAPDICNSIDDDCDGLIDEGIDRDDTDGETLDVTWYADADGDGYGNPDVTHLSCAAPNGFVANNTDCNDSNAAINPGATEVCNGFDDDCNGQIDDGLTGIVFVGNVAFMSQAQVNAWGPCFSTIQGDLHIMFSGIVDLTPLGNLTKVTGSVTIQYTNLTTLKGLNSLFMVGGDLTIHDNGKLTTLLGLSALTKVGGGLGIYYNTQLSNCCPIQELLNSASGITGFKVISGNKTGCETISQISSACSGRMLNSGFGGMDIVTPGFDQQVTLYPNPASGKVFILFEKSFEEGKLDVYDLNGKVIRSQNLDGKSTRLELDLKGAVPGIYLTRVILDGQVFTKRLVVE